MGIDVINKQVFYNDTHQYGLNTSPTVNPHIQLLNKTVKVSSIFRRRQLKHDEGDGNPFIYALKKKNGYRISRVELCRFIPDFSQILMKTMSNKGSVLLLPMPSSHKIVDVLARRAAALCAGAAIERQIFEKKTTGDIATEISNLDLPRELRKDASKLVRQLNTATNATFAMKEVKSTKLRTHIAPIRLASKMLPSADEIILVDDLYSSGSTLMSAYQELRSAGVTAPISALCLLSCLS